MNRLHFSFLLPLTFFFNCTNNTSPGKMPVVDKTTDIPLAAKNNSALGLFDLTKPSHSWRLPDQLVEVSGNSWVDANRLVLIEDLHPALYLIKLDDKNAKLEKTIPFAETEKDKVDIEDVTVVNNAVYALWSHGVLFKISDWKGTPKVERIKTGLTKENNTEGLCYDPVSKTLMIACKDDAGIGDDKKSARAVYQFDMNKQRLMRPPYMVIHAKDFEKVTRDKLRFNPSAIAVQPTTHDIYILTTKDNKGMAIFSHDGVLKSYQPIDKELMPQPEGICFSPDGKMYISSEGKKGEPGNLFEFDK